MNSLDPAPSFVWSEPRALEEQLEYESQPPFRDLVKGASGVFGIVSAITGLGVDVIDGWLQDSQGFKASLVVTRISHLEESS